MGRAKTNPYMLVWKRGSNLMNLPIGLATSVKGEGKSDKLVCDGCNATTLKQRYECEGCGKIFSSIGMVKQRHSEDWGVNYDIEEKRDFLTVSIERTVEVLGEVPLGEVMKSDIEILNATNTLEVFSNDREIYQKTIQQVWQFLMQQGVALKVKVGHRGDQWLGYLMATYSGKIVITKLLDEESIKQPYQVDNPPITRQISSESFSRKAQLETEFYTLKSEGKPIERKEVEQVITPIIAENFFTGVETVIPKKVEVPCQQ